MNKKGISWKDVFLGFFAGVALTAVIAMFTIPSIIRSSVGTGTQTADNTQSSSSEDIGELRQYVTTQKEWETVTSDGTTLKFYTPEGWYSLADQYNDGLTEYYGVELPADNIACVGDNTDQYKATCLINSRPLSNTSEVLSTIYKDEYDEATMLYSDTYEYMKNGTEPTDTTIEELESITSGDGHVYRVFLHGFDTEYYTDEEQTETTTVHTDEIISYSDTEDAVEIIMYMAEFNKDEAIAKLREFLGAE